MIDFLDLTITLKHKLFGAKRIIQNEEKTSKRAKQYSKKVRLFDGAHMLDVTSMKNGTLINIRGCALKAMQGHNIFGTDNVCGLGYFTIMYVLAVLGITPDPAQVARWKQGLFLLEEVHITNRLPVESHAQIGRVFTYILRNMAQPFRAAPISVGTGIRLCNPKSGTSWLMYDKLREYDDKRTRQGHFLEAIVGDDVDEITNLLRDAASSNIRAELKLGKKYLLKHGLSTGSAWNKAKVNEIYQGELALLDFGKVPSISYAEQLLDTLDDMKLRVTFLAWMHGEDLKQLHGIQTLNSRRREILLATGIDIKLDCVPLEESALSIADIFDASNILENFPEWTEQHPRIAFRGQELAIDHG